MKGTDPKTRLDRLCAIAVVGLLIAAGATTAGLLLATWSVADEVGEPLDPTPTPSRLYARPLGLYPGQRLDRPTLVEYLSALGYREAAEPAVPPAAGHYLASDSGLTLTTRRPFHPAGPGPGRRIEIELDEHGVATLAADGERVSSVALEPIELFRYHDDRLIERRESACETESGRLPEVIRNAILAAEDDRFENHHGIALSAIARAAVANLAAGGIRQGGSTITQQLARNRFLTHERSWHRKVREAFMALVLESRHEKDELLCAYADLVYFGVRDGVSLIGVGAAASDYFGKRADDLTLAEAATLAGAIAAPSRYAPSADSETARARRDWVLRRMRELEWIGDGELAAALAEPVMPRANRGASAVDARHYAVAVARELESTLGIAAVDQAELTIDGTLDWLDQLRAERTVRESAAELEERYASRVGDDLEASLLSVDPATGGVLAYVGGRDYHRSQFDRVLQARRQVGSLFKPIVFASAFAARIVHPETPVADRPIAFRYGDEIWTPRNYEADYHGTVTARRALELSLNSATLRIAAGTGFAEIRRRANDLGLDVGPDPAVVLGAAEASPWEMAEAFGSFARGGRALAHTTIARVSDPSGERLERAPRTERRVFDAETAHLVNSTLQGVITRGTGARAWRAGLRDRIAGKTGTSNDRRDTWFVGYTPDRLTVVWTGRDGFGETPLTGTTGALPIWIRFTQAIRPAAGFAEFDTSDLDREVLDTSNTDVWPACASPLLEPSVHCLEDGDGLVYRLGAGRSETRLVHAAAGGSRGIDMWRSGGTVVLATVPRTGVSPRSRPAFDLVDPDPELDYELRDLVEIDDLGDAVAAGREWLPVTER